MKLILLAAVSADGYIGRDAGHLATTWTTNSDKQLFLRLAKDVRVLVMGLNTFLTTAEKNPTAFSKSIPDRRLIVFTHHPETVDDYPAEIETTSEAPKALTERLEAEGVKSALICGGTQIYRQFLETGLIDELYLSMQPTLFGDGVRLLDRRLTTSLSLLDTQVYTSDGTAVLHYRIDKAGRP